MALGFNNDDIQLPVDTEWGENDRQTIASINDFFRNGCGCNKGSGDTQCIYQFTRDHASRQILQCNELSKSELEMMILGQLTALTVNNGNRQYTNFRHQGLDICRTTFCFMHAIGKRYLENLQQHFKANGVSVRTHGNSRKRPVNITSHEDVERVTNFIKSFSIHHGLSLPGRVPSHRLVYDNTVFLPSNETKASVHRKYFDYCMQNNTTDVSYDIFIRTWKSLLPNIKVIQPRTDLCFQCQQNTNTIMGAANESREAKKKALEAQQQHLFEADLQKQDYNYRISLTRNDYKETFLEAPPAGPPNTLQIQSVYLFDFAQQVQYPMNPQQPGAIFFKVPRKTGLFGINNEGLKRQVNYIIDEIVDTGKGANVVISYLHHYLEHHSVGEKIVHLQADNCCGQNKNNFMLQYLCWRTFKGLHDHITLNFLIAGHTKFSVDRGFGGIKQSYQNTFCSSLFDILDVVNRSTVNESNVGELVGLPNVDVLVPVYDWSSMLRTIYKTLPRISSYHHFRFTHEKPGFVYVQEFANSEEIEIKLIRENAINPLRLPEIIPPRGLSRERKDYLFKEIRKFCREGTADLVAPPP